MAKTPKPSQDNAADNTPKCPTCGKPNTQGTQTVSLNGSSITGCPACVDNARAFGAR